MDAKHKRCLKFAQLYAKANGMTYQEATKKYPRGYNEKSVYWNDLETVDAHCVHCARVEAIQRGG